MSSEFPLKFIISISGETQAIQAFKGIGSSAQQMSTQVQSAATGAQQAGRSLDQVGDTAARTQSKMTRFAAGMASLGTAVGGITSLASAIDNVGDAQDRLTAKQTRLARQNESVDQAFKALQRAVQQYGAGSQQAGDATDKLNLAIRRQQDAANALKNAQEDVTFAQANMAGAFIQTGAGIAGMVASFANVSAASRTASAGLNGVAEAGRGMTFKMGAIGAILAGIGLALAAIGTNFMGFRDALDGIGEAIGNALPGLKPFLEGIRNMAGIMGLTGEQTKNTAMAAEDLGESSMAASQGLASMGASTRQTSSDLGQLKAQYFSTINQIKQGAAVGPGGVVGSREALERMGIPSAEIFEGAAAERVTAMNKGFASLVPTVTTGIDNSQLDTGITEAKTKISGADWAGAWRSLQDAFNSSVAAIKSVEVSDIAVAAKATVTWLIDNVWPTVQSIIDAIPTTLKELKVAAVATLTWAISSIWPNAADVTLPSSLQELKVASLATIDWTVKNIWPTLQEILAEVPSFLNQLEIESVIRITIGNALFPDWKDIKFPKLPDIPIPQIPVPKLPDFTSIKWPTLPAIPLPDLPDIVGAIKDAFTGFSWPALPAFPAPNFSDFLLAVDKVTRAWTRMINTVGQSSFGGKALQQLATGTGGRRHGGIDLVTSPTTLRVGEGFHPELISVVPLTGPHAPSGMRNGGQIATGPLHYAAGGVALGGITGPPPVSLRPSAPPPPSPAPSPVKKESAAMKEYIRLIKEYLKSRNRLTLEANRALGMNTPLPFPAVGLRHGGSFMTRRPTGLMVGEGGPEYVSVTPSRGMSATGAGGPGGNDLSRLIASVEKIARRGQGWNANLYVDGQRMANVSQKYTGMKGYGDR